uniref:Chromosome 20 open reading frame 204 n=1 Tax=Propithecus coquereli TaxID=379532 RepID=A0A2K6GB75_PROCO
MVPPRSVLWALLLALLVGTAPGRARLYSCSIPDVLRHYRAVIFEDLQAAMRWVGPGPEGISPGSRHLHFVRKNLTEAGGSGRQGRPAASCGAQKEHSILLSIASLGRTLRGAAAGGRRGALEKAAWTVAVRTEAVMRRHCRTPRQRMRRLETRPAQRRGGRRQLLLRALDAVATCWEKLFALRAAASGAP